MFSHVRICNINRREEKEEISARIPELVGEIYTHTHIYIAKGTKTPKNKNKIIQY